MPPFVAIYGAQDVMRALNQMDPAAKREIDKALRDAASDVVRIAKGYVDPQGLSGWTKWRGGYDPVAIASEIKVKRGGSRKRGNITKNFVGVRNWNPAGTIWELAGRKSSGKTPAGAAFIRNITARGGAPSRTVWAAADSSEAGGAKDKIVEAMNRAAALVQSGIDKA